MLQNRCAVFIDGGYFEKVLKYQFNEERINLLEFSELVSGETERLKTYYYNCMPMLSDPPTEKEKKLQKDRNRFISSIRKLPRFEIRLGKLVKRSHYDKFGNLVTKHVQKRVDVLLAVDLVRMSIGGQINKAVMVAGDSDYVPAVETANDAGVLTQVYYHPTSKSDELLDACGDRFIITQELIDKVKLYD
jgi:uncharacterized LabA/DUF88 family protein